MLAYLMKGKMRSATFLDGNLSLCNQISGNVHVLGPAERHLGIYPKAGVGKMHKRYSRQDI